MRNNRSLKPPGNNNSEQKQNIVKIVENNELQSLKTLFQRPNIVLSHATFSTYPNPNQYEYILPPVNLTLLHIAAIYDSLECFVFLLDQPDFHVRMLSANSHMPLHYACFYNSFEVFKYILQVDKSIVLEIQPFQYSFLNLAIHSHNPLIMKDLLDSGTPFGSYQYRLIDVCIEHQTVDCLKILCEKIGSHYHAQNTTLLIEAAKSCSPEMLEMLLPTQNDIDFVSEKGESIFSFMAFNGIESKPIYKSIILKMLACVCGKTIEPPLYLKCKGVCHWICRLADVDIAKAMLKTSNIQINRLDNMNNPGLFEFTYKSADQTNKIIAIIQLLLDHGLNINARAPAENGVYKSYSILESFCKSIVPNQTIIQFLISKGADVNALLKNSPNVTLLDFMCNRSNKLQSYFQSLKKCNDK